MSGEAIAPRMTGRQRVALVLVVASAALVVRWTRPEPALAFAPREDALEYVASAQSIAQRGSFLLQVGPHRLRPRYAPGFPLLLALFLKVGVPPESLWRVAGALGAAAAGLMALLAAALATRLAPRVNDGAPQPLVAWTAGLATGFVWVASPVAVRVGRAVMSDQPAALAAVGALVALGGALLLANHPRAVWMAGLGGLLWGITAIMRPVTGALLLAPLATLALASLWLSPRGRTLRCAIVAGVGFTVPCAIACILLIRSGLPPLPWSGYHFWLPDQFGSLTRTFRFQSALEPIQGLGAGGAPLSNFQVGTRVLLGLPGIKLAHQPGRFWPLLGSLAGVGLWLVARRRGPRAAQLSSAIAWAVIVWALAHLLMFSPYAFSGGRFYLPVLTAQAVLFGAGIGVGLAFIRRQWRPCAVLVVALTLFAVSPAHRSRFLPAEYRPPPLERAVPKRVRAWLAMTDAARASTPMRFDPVYAQALGLLDEAAISSVTEWGQLPPTWHVRQLVRLGHVNAAEMASPGPPAERARPST